MTDARTHDSHSDGPETELRLPRVVLPQPPEPDATKDAPRWRRIAAQALVLWVVTRVAYLILGAFALILPQTHAARGAGFFGVWQRFDTNWYLSIATEGYHIPQQVAFFPVYPALIRITSIFLGGNSFAAALLVANLGALTALIALGGLAAWEMPNQRAATWAMLTLLIYPFSFFAAAAYPDGVFLTFTALCILFARQGRWRRAAVMALLAGATQSTGIALIALLAWEWLRQQGLLQFTQWRALLASGRVQAARAWLRALEQASRREWAGLLAVAAVPGAIAALGVFAAVRFHQPTVIFDVRHDYWGTQSAPIWTTLDREITHMLSAPFASDAQIIMLLDLISLALATGALIALCRRIPVAYTLYMVSLLYLCVAQPAASGAQVLAGPGRYLVAAIPLFLGSQALLKRRPRVRAALIYLGIALQCYIALRFLTGTLIE